MYVSYIGTVRGQDDRAQVAEGAYVDICAEVQFWPNRATSYRSPSLPEVSRLEEKQRILPWFTGRTSATFIGGLDIIPTLGYPRALGFGWKTAYAKLLDFLLFPTMVSCRVQRNIVILPIFPLLSTRNHPSQPLSLRVRQSPAASTARLGHRVFVGQLRLGLISLRQPLQAWMAIYSGPRVGFLAIIANTIAWDAGSACAVPK
jgi:hypothetical protein